jgi:uncharacterized protein (TIGR02145 family)
MTRNKNKVRSRWFVKLLLSGSCLLMISCSGGVKDFDGNLYRTFEVGKSTWMKENLNVAHFRNGDPIPEVRTEEEWVKAGNEGKPACCFFGNDSVNGIKYGRLYNWYAVNDTRGLAPKGWHAATDDDWTYTINYLGGGVLAALKMRTTGLSEKSTDDELNSFSGLAAGCRNNSGVFYGLDSFGYWWCADELNMEAAWLRVLNYVRCDVNSMEYSKAYGASVRCVKN